MTSAGEWCVMLRQELRRRFREFLFDYFNLSLCDGIHNTAQANVALGEKLAKQCAHVLNGKEEYQPPELVKVERADEAERKSFQLEEAESG